MKISKSSAEHYTWGNQCDGWHLLKNDNLSVIHEKMPANTSERRHYHSKASQFFFILSGTATMELDGQFFIVLPQEGIEVPPLVPHQIFNKTDMDLEFLVISQPATRGDRVIVD
ncbi:cupin domain-containing protein [Cytobacillus sp. FJAT-54145]|uniref:Cupin domain-containing protein n=1 Tax=Cytobacillus spartinae TaxID=3299023 RepID=A0ABW6KHC8_9BACI